MVFTNLNAIPVIGSTLAIQFVPLMTESVEDIDEDSFSVINNGLNVFDFEVKEAFFRPEILFRNIKTRYHDQYFFISFLC